MEEITKYIKYRINSLKDCKVNCDKNALEPRDNLTEYFKTRSNYCSERIKELELMARDLNINI